MQVVGIDGCKYGWVAVALDDKGGFSILKFKKIYEAIAAFPNATRYLLDMVIGLPDKNHPRMVEQLARKKLKPYRTSSVFTPPCRKAVYANSYEMAKAINLEEMGKSISIQTWNIVPKIKEVDTFLFANKLLQKRIWEAHPEICFAALNNGVAMEFKKNTKEGEEERLTILQTKEKKALQIFEKGAAQFLRKEVKKDDLLDAIGLAVNGLLGERSEYDMIFSKEQKKDGKGIEMKMCCWKSTLEAGQADRECNRPF